MKVESFELDHTAVVAPYIRKVNIYTGEKGDKLSKFDLRFMQPNKEAMDMPGIHTMEHLLAVYLREESLGDDIIDLSPMGCRTGFYLMLWGEKDVLDIEEILLNALKKVLETEEIPGATEKQCGNYKEHSLEQAIEYSKKFLNDYKRENNI